MGYRHYLHVVDKKLVAKIRKCTSQKEIWEVINNNSFREDNEQEFRFSLDDLGECVFEFGKYYEGAEALYQLGKPLFKSKIMQDEYEDYAPIYGGEELIKAAIDWQEGYIKKLYSDLVKNEFDNPYVKEIYYKNMSDKEIQYKRLLNHAEDYLYWWEHHALDENKENVALADSWLYEHTIFTLVRIYKDFNPQKQCFVFFGR